MDWVAQSAWHQHRTSVSTAAGVNHPLGSLGACLPGSNGIVPTPSIPTAPVQVTPAAFPPHTTSLLFHPSSPWQHNSADNDSQWLKYSRDIFG